MGSRAAYNVHKTVRRRPCLWRDEEGRFLPRRKGRGLRVVAIYCILERMMDSTCADAMYQLGSLEVSTFVTVSIAYPSSLVQRKTKVRDPLTDNGTGRPSLSLSLSL
mmetsp:Transcript_1362/g.3936  ORF Transcript_1362/g.3936 Transcript_1362/m.3936 type:complete len:107 (+) Transcript_1362:363-683(+)